MAKIMYAHKEKLKMQILILALGYQSNSLMETST